MTNKGYANRSWAEIKQPSRHYGDSKEFSAERLITGKAAEEYFVQKCPTIELFNGFHITNTTDLGCGFDFKRSYPRRTGTPAAHWRFGCTDTGIFS